MQCWLCSPFPAQKGRAVLLAVVSGFSAQFEVDKAWLGCVGTSAPSSHGPGPCASRGWELTCSSTPCCRVGTGQSQQPVPPNTRAVAPTPQLLQLDVHVWDFTPLFMPADPWWSRVQTLSVQKHAWTFTLHGPHILKDSRRIIFLSVKQHRTIRNRFLL